VADRDLSEQPDDLLMQVLGDASALTGAKRDACEALWLRHASSLQRLARTALRALGECTLDPLDVVQEVFARLLSVQPRFQGNRPLWPWLRRVLQNRMWDLLWRERRERSQCPLEYLAPQARCRSPEELASEREEYAAAMGQLTEEERDLVQAFYFEGKTPSDLAAERNRNVLWTYRQLHRAREKIRKFLADRTPG